MNTNEAIKIASNHLKSLDNHIFDLLTIAKPISPEAAVNLAKVVSKLSPILGNLIEFNTVEYLNDVGDFKPFGTWIRQDPGFPDAILRGTINPAPGFEIKTWFPLATEITARFKDSQNHFQNDETYLAMLAWLPEKLIFGRPKILDVCIVSCKSVAEARDIHYHNPPDYLVLEPEDTSSRTRNLQQTNTNGYKWQGNAKQFTEAKKIVNQWGEEGRNYQPTREYQSYLRQLIARFPYRLDTNFAKMDRIDHPEIEKFKQQVLSKEFKGRSIGDWNRIFNVGEETELKEKLETNFEIIDQNATNLIS